MPGPAIHHIVAKEVSTALRAQLDASHIPFLDRLNREYSPAFCLGSQGPDFLFFNTKDIDPSVRNLVDYYIEVTDFVEDIKQKITDIIPDELKDAAAALEAAADRSAAIDQIKDLLSKVQNLITSLTDIITAKVEVFVTDKVNLFDLLKHPIQDGQKHNVWWWFDTLHYRRTGKYAQTLLSLSAAGSLERAYALGYLTHYSADVVGHPFVNIISGGPYRTHAKRHKLIENNQDVWAYKEHTNGGEFIQSKLGEAYIIAGDEKKLPDSLNSLILGSLEKVYFKNGNSLYGRPMTKDDLNAAYRLWLMWFRKTTNALDLPKPEPYSFTAEIAEVWDQFAQNLEDLGSTISDGLSGNGGISGILKGLGAAILAPLLVSAAAIDFVLGIIETIGAAPIQFFIALIYDELYNAYMNLHQALVLNGFAFPFNSQLSHYLTQHVFGSAIPDRLGHNAASLMQYYPTTKFSIPGMECESHLVYPIPIDSNVESDKCMGAPLSYYRTDVNRYVSGPLMLSQEGYEQLKHFVEKTGGDTESTTKLKFKWLKEYVQKDNLGSAIDFSCFLYKEFLGNKTFADFNLDGDKGIAYKAWRKVNAYVHVNNPASPHVSVGSTVQDVQTDIIDPSEDIL
ncbi:MAG: zinc dependent phospholipase C family protein [Pseudomonadota bacterium]